MNQKTEIYNCIEKNKYVPSTQITSIIYYDLLKLPDGNLAFKIVDTKDPQGKGHEKKSPGTFSTQIFHFNDFNLDQIGDSAIKLERAYGINGKVETPNYINNTRGFIKPILIQIQKYIDEQGQTT